MVNFEFRAKNLYRYVRCSKILSGIADLECKCGSSQKEIIEEPVKFQMEGKGQLPDILTCGEYPYRILSKRTIEVFKENGIDGFLLAEAWLYDNKGILKSKDYYILILKNKVDLDLEAMDVKVIYSGCPICGSRVMYNKKTREFGKAIFIGTFDYNLYKLNNRMLTTYCSLKVVQLAQKHNLTNFSFKKAEDTFDEMQRSINAKDMLKQIKINDKNIEKDDTV